MKFTKEQIAADYNLLDWLRLKDLYVDGLSPAEVELFFGFTEEIQDLMVQAAMDEYS